MTTHITLILDETGSMQSVHDQVVSGYNEYVSELRKLKKAKFTVVRFNSGKNEASKAVKTKDIKDLVDYSPGGMTPLYDAVGRAIREVDMKKGDKAIVAIQTDGYENCSKEYDQKSIGELIRKKQEEGNWTFVFLGADQDAWANAAKMGIAAGNTVAYASANTKGTFRQLGGQTVAHACSDSISTKNFWDDSKTAPS